MFHMTHFIYHTRSALHRLFICLVLFAAPIATFADEAIFNNSGLPIPRFVSLKSNEVNVRVGPGTRYPIRWVYQRANLPVEVIEEFSHWRKIRDHQGETGWVHKALLSGSRTAMITHETHTLYAQPDATSPALVRAEAGTIGHVINCQEEWCQLSFRSRKAWIERHKVWGVYNDETIRQ